MESSQQPRAIDGQSAQQTPAAPAPASAEPLAAQAASGDAANVALPLPSGSSAGDIGAALGPGVLPDSTSLVQLSLSLLVVIGLIVGISWLLRRMQSLPGGGGEQMRILATLAVGTRERILMIDAAGTRLLVALAPGAIRTLHVFAADDTPAVAVDADPSSDGGGGSPPFGQLLKSLKRTADQERSS